MSKFFLTARKNLRANSSGQAAVELAMTTVILLVLMCAAADFGCALNDMQILSELTRQGSNLASRGTTLAQTNADLLAGDSGLGLASNGRVVITQLTQATPRAGGPYTVAAQAYSLTGISQTSKVAPSGSGTITLTGAPALQTGQSLFVTEIFYTYTALTGIGALTGGAVGMPSVLYDVAYF
jgi:Flp pilus assembly protein TadG